MTVVCAVAEDCLLPCGFPPSSNETIRWFRQDVEVHTFERAQAGDASRGQEHLSVDPALVSYGNATLLIRRSGLKDRGPYVCHVSTLKGEHRAKVIVRVEGERKNTLVRCSGAAASDTPSVCVCVCVKHPSRDCL